MAVMVPGGLVDSVSLQLVVKEDAGDHIEVEGAEFLALCDSARECALHEGVRCSPVVGVAVPVPVCLLRAVDLPLNLAWIVSASTSH